MTVLQSVACLWTLALTLTAPVCSDIQFLERNEGDSVVLPCVVDQRNPAPLGMYLKRTWLQHREVLFMYTKREFSMHVDADKNRTSISGDPSSHSLNVTISELRASDTDRYYCEFVVEQPSSEDEHVPGNNEFFLLVSSAGAAGADAPGLVESCAGGSVVLPCLPPHRDKAMVEGVSLKRQKMGQAAVEVLYHHPLTAHYRSSRSSSPPSSTQFPAERVQLSLAPGPGGITYDLTLLQLQPDDSALYSCQLLLQDRPDSTASLGRQVYFVSVQGGQCGCSSYSTLLYSLSSAVAVLVLLLGCMMVYKGKSRRSIQSHPQAPIYEDMTRVKATSQKLPLHPLEETECSEYTNCRVKKSCPENHYESPSGALCPRS
ncbi:hypothetical protein D5F01_LYC00138 [Larimichthys crocea]|uniref:Ig-like domain-containing protein n=1 Tax=Larimichthys crocea TaxID=215358 RepID=A0A6G0J8T1_LARCR|nr:hypothetical protein D5F01_LYC00138 [Larimichthys crocea]